MSRPGTGGGTMGAPGRLAGGCVVDASVAVKWVVEEEGSDLAASILSLSLAAPALLTSECANILWRKARQGLLTAGEAEARHAALRRRGLRLLPDETLAAGALARALRHGHPVYDCLYLEAAAATGLPLVTADRRLAALAEDGASVLLLGDLSAA